MISKWPEYRDDLSFPAEEAAFGKLMELIKAIRLRRADMGIPPSKKAKLFIEAPEAADRRVFADGAPFLMRLASASGVEVGESFPTEGSVQIVTHAARALSLSVSRPM